MENRLNEAEPSRQNNNFVQLGDIRLELLRDGERFFGIGAVACDGVPLRSDLRAWWVEIRAPNGFESETFRLLNISEDAAQQSATLDFAVTLQRSGAMEWMLHETRARRETSNWGEYCREYSRENAMHQAATLRLELRAVTREIGGRTFRGFSYRFHYHSVQASIYYLLERGTWEIGGSCVGSEFWLRNATAPSLRTFTSADEFYSTEWYLPGLANPNIFQFLPFQTQFCGFTFTAATGGTLLTWSPQVAHLRSLFEKKSGRAELEHWHEHSGDLSSRFSGATIEVLFCDLPADRVERANLHEAAREMVSQTLHEAVSLRRERVSTYGMMEEWGLPNLAKYTEKGVPALLQAGAKTVAFPNFFQNNMNVWGVSNMCCTVDWKIPDTLGEDAFANFCRAIRDGGARAQMWGNTALSSLTLIFDLDHQNPHPLPHDRRRLKLLPRKDSIMEALQNAREPFVRNASGAIEADHYTPVFCQLNLRDEVVVAYWMKRWGEAAQKFGLNGVFLDSSFNMTSDKFHFHFCDSGDETGATLDQTHLLSAIRPRDEPPSRIESQYFAHLDLMRAMQRIGYEICGEDLGVFGLSRSGPPLSTRIDNLFLWSDCLMDFDALEAEKLGADADTIFFTGLAYRLMWVMHFDVQREHLSFRQNQGWRDARDTPCDWHLQVWRAFAVLEAQMLKREILPAERGVFYSGTDADILWAFEDFNFAVATKNVVIENVLNGQTEISSNGVLRAQRHRIYRFTPQ